MTATTPQAMEGTQAPSQIEYLYERYRHLLKWILVLVVAYFGVTYAWRYYEQGKIDSTWSGFAAITGIEEAYADKEGYSKALTDLVAKKDLASLEQALGGATKEQMPFLLLAIARKSIVDRNWDRAESALTDIERSFPGHALVVENPYPIQVRDPVKEDPKVEQPQKQKKPEYKPEKSGSIVAMMRAQIAESKDYTRPAQFAKPEIPADAPKVKFEFSGDYGSITIALMEKEAPLHVAKFKELVEQGFWKDLNVDEIQRPGTGFYKMPMQFHLGFTTTKEPDRTKWTKTDPSTNQVEFEDTGLSHFSGAVAARIEADGKSCADRFYICPEDNAQMDDTRVVFGYVVEGLENAEEICKAGMSAQEEESGRGVPTDNITVVNVTMVQ